MLVSEHRNHAGTLAVEWQLKLLTYMHITYFNYSSATQNKTGLPDPLPTLSYYKQ